MPKPKFYDKLMKNSDYNIKVKNRKSGKTS